MSTLVFLEHHDGEFAKNALGVLGKAASLGGDVHGVVIGSGVREHRGRRREVRRGEGLERGRPGARGAAAAAARRRARETRSRQRLRHCAVRAERPRRRRRRGSRGAARCGAELGPRRPRRQDGDALVGKRPALQDSVYVDVGWKSEPRLALFRSGSFDPQETGGDAEVDGRRGRAAGLLHGRDDGRAGARRERAARRSRTPR